MSVKPTEQEFEVFLPRSESFDLDYSLNGSMENLPSDKTSGVYFSRGKAVKQAGECFKLTHHVTKQTFGLAKITKTSSIHFSEFSETHQKLMLDNDDSHVPETQFTKYQYDIVADVVPVDVKRPEWICGATFMILPSNYRLAGGLNDEPLKQRAINPLTKQAIPIWVSDYAGTDAHLAVPAHNKLDNEFAREHNLPIVPVVAQDFGKPLPDAKDVLGVVVIGYDPKSDKYLGLRHGPQAWLVGGGHEEGETYAQTARRELTEEAGFSKVIKLIPLGDPVYSYYYNDIKQSNRRSLGYNYLAIVDQADQHEQRQESHESFTVWWTEFDDLYNDIAKTGGGVEHWLEALKRAKAAASAFNSAQEYIPKCYEGEGTMVNSGKYDGMSTKSARASIRQLLGPQLS